MTAAALASLLAAPIDDAGSGVDAGLVGFLIFIGLFVVGGLLMRSMFTHARRVPSSFDPPPGTPDAEDEPNASDEGPSGSRSAG